MTLIIGYRGENLSIVISDDRVTFTGDVGEYFEDGHTKLVELPDMGWSVAGGLVSFIDAYKKGLADNEISIVGDISDLYRYSVDEAVQSFPEYSDSIMSSEILATWFGTEANLADFAFHVGVINANTESNEGISVLNKNQIYIGFPYGIDVDEIIKYKQEYSFLEDEGDLGEILKRLLKVFHDISSNSDYASTYCDIGIHLLDLEGKPKVCKIKVSGESEDLLNDENLISRFEVVSEIS